MVSRGTSQTNLKMMMAMGGGAIFLLLALVGGVVGWFSRDTPEQVGPPQVGRGLVSFMAYQRINFL